MNNTLKLILISVISLIILAAVIFGILLVIEANTLIEAQDGFIKSSYLILIIGSAAALLSIIVSKFKK